MSGGRANATTISSPRAKTVLFLGIDPLRVTHPFSIKACRQVRERPSPKRVVRTWSSRLPVSSEATTKEATSSINSSIKSLHLGVVAHVA